MSFRRACPLLVIVSFIVSVIAAAGSVSAAPVGSPVARSVAVAFLDRLHALDRTVAGDPEIAGDPSALAYVFSLEPTGYVVVAADDALPPVVAYSLESVCPAGTSAGNPLKELLIADLKARWSALPLLDDRIREQRRRDWSALAGDAADRDDARRFQQWPPAGTTPTGGWLAGNWTQNAPYNALCPLDLAHGGTRSLAGCPSVAMAMILDFHGTIQGTTFGGSDRYYHNYAGNAYWIPDAAIEYGFPSFPALNSNLQTLTSHWDLGSPLTNTDKASLTFACGIAATQVYSASGSGTFGVSQAYDAYQRFAFAGSRLVYDTDPQMYPALSQNMMDALPAHLAIVDPGWTMGHNVVVDGYNTDNYFHLNFGWGGAYNGWYLLPQEIPYGLTVVEGLILDIVPGPSSVPGIPVRPASFALVSYPNPCRPAVTLRFTAPSAEPAHLGLYDVAGRLQATVFDGVTTAGPQELTIGTGHLAGGVYLARLEIGGRVESRRLVVIR